MVSASFRQSSAAAGMKTPRRTCESGEYRGPTSGPALSGWRSYLDQRHPSDPAPAIQRGFSRGLAVSTTRPQKGDGHAESPDRGRTRRRSCLRPRVTRLFRRRLARPPRCHGPQRPRRPPPYSCPRATRRCTSIRPTSRPTSTTPTGRWRRGPAGPTARPTGRAARRRWWSSSPTSPRRSPTGSPPASCATPSPRTARSWRTPTTGTRRTADGQHLVPRRGHRRVRGRQGRESRRLVRGRASTARCPGIAIPAEPAAGHGVPPGVLQGRGRGQRTGPQHGRAGARCPPASYRDALLTKDFTPLEPDVLEYKLYAHGRGPGPHPHRVRRGGS